MPFSEGRVPESISNWIGKSVRVEWWNAQPLHPLEHRESEVYTLVAVDSFLRSLKFRCVDQRDEFWVPIYRIWTITLDKQ